MELDILIPRYKGGELVGRLKTFWPDVFARSLAEQNLCSAVGILRWMMMSLAEEGFLIVRTNPGLNLTEFAVADFPSAENADAKLRGIIENVIAGFCQKFSHSRSDGNAPDLFDILESKEMINSFWSKTVNLLYNETACEKRGKVVFECDLPADEIARDGLIRIEDPRKLVLAIQDKLAPSWRHGTNDRLFHTMTPPKFIRVLWDSSFWSAPSYGDSPFHVLRKLTIRHENAQIEGEQLEFSQVSVSYRLICLARIPQPGDQPVAVHLYEYDGRNFVPPYGSNKDQNWSCKNQGKYYLVYHKSDAPDNPFDDNYPPECKAPLPEFAQKKLKLLREFAYKQPKKTETLKRPRSTIEQPVQQTAPDSQPRSILKPPSTSQPARGSRPAVNPNPVQQIAPRPRPTSKPTSVEHTSTDTKEEEEFHVFPFANSPRERDDMNPGTFSQWDIQVDGQMLSRLIIQPRQRSPPPPPPASRPSVSFLDDAQHNTDMDHGDRREDTYEPGEIGSRSASPAPKRKRTSRGKGRRRKRANGQSGPNVPGEPSRPGDQSRPRERSRPREQSPIRNRSQYWSPSINTRSPRDMHSDLVLPLRVIAQWVTGTRECVIREQDLDPKVRVDRVPGITNIATHERHIAKSKNPYYKITTLRKF
ncbi:hypothetical protein F4815DRAFT_504935 [Daldinia loculata]|nr:hypothetical protein F4815DRAFT_504935 [Daldinia loculata]